MFYHNNKKKPTSPVKTYKYSVFSLSERNGGVSSPRLLRSSAVDGPDPCHSFSTSPSSSHGKPRIIWGLRQAPPPWVRWADGRPALGVRLRPRVGGHTALTGVWTGSTPPGRAGPSCRGGWRSWAPTGLRCGGQLDGRVLGSDPVTTRIAAFHEMCCRGGSQAAAACVGLWPVCPSYVGWPG